MLHRIVRLEHAKPDHHDPHDYLAVCACGFDFHVSSGIRLGIMAITDPPNGDRRARLMEQCPTCAFKIGDQVYVYDGEGDTYEGIIAEEKDNTFRVTLFDSISSADFWPARSLRFIRREVRA